jgi:hypothetical protein
MRLFVGTLYTSENEFDQCCKAIGEQTYRNFHHEIIRNLPKKEAHEELYGMFMQRAGEYDLLVKVDADMVIEDRDLFGKIVKKFEKDPELDLLLIAVHDYFTDELLLGLNVFRNTVRWNLGDEELFTDMTYDKDTVRKIVKDFEELAPAAMHCKNPTEFQAFHYGFHRGVKAVRGGTNWRVLKSIFLNYRRNPDLRLAFALLGANGAFTNRFSIQHISYNDDTLLNYYNEKYDGKEPIHLHREVKRTKLFRLFSLPIDMRILYRYYRFKAKLFQ